MTDLTADRAVAALQGAPSVALPLAELARRLGFVDPEALAVRLAPDPRLLLLDSPGLPAPVCPSPERQAAYDRALRSAGLAAGRRVVLVAPALIPRTAGLGPLLRASTARLAGAGPDGRALTAAAERVQLALQAMGGP